MEISSTSRMLAQVVTPNSCPVDMEEVGNISKIWSAGCPLIDWGSCPEPSHFPMGQTSVHYMQRNIWKQTIMLRPFSIEVLLASSQSIWRKDKKVQHQTSHLVRHPTCLGNNGGFPYTWNICVKSDLVPWRIKLSLKPPLRELHMPSSVSTLSPPHPAFLEPRLTCATTRWYHIKDGQGTYTPSACMFVFPGQQPSSVFMDILRKICKTSSTLKILSKKHPAFWFPSTSLNYHLFFGGDGFSVHFVLRSSNLDLTGISSAWSDGAYSYMIVTTKWYSFHKS